MFTHDSIKGTVDDSATTTQYKCSAVSILVQSETLAKHPISDTVFTSRKCLRASSLDRYKSRSDKLEKKSTLMIMRKCLVNRTWCFNSGCFFRRQLC